MKLTYPMKSESELRMNPHLGVCLSGGGALGFAHVGVLQALEEHGIFPATVSGTSMGAIVGAIYSAGYSPSDIHQMVLQDKLYKVTRLMTFRRGFAQSGLSSHSMLRTLIKELIPHNSFEQLSRKIHICVSNLTNSVWEIKSSGKELDKWVAASASIPGLFEAVHSRTGYYVDGGVLNNLPAQALYGVCDTIIGVDVIPHVPPLHLNKPIESMTSSVRAMQHQNSLEGRGLCNFLIEPRGIETYHEFSFDAYDALYHYGYEAAQEYIAMHPGILSLSAVSLL